MELLIRKSCVCVPPEAHRAKSEERMEDKQLENTHREPHVGLHSKVYMQASRAYEPSNEHAELHKEPTHVRGDLILDNEQR